MLAHELSHIQRQVSGGWGGGFPAEALKEQKSAFQKMEEFRAAAEGEQPLRSLLGVRPRGHVSTSIEIQLNTPRLNSVTDLAGFIRQ